MSDTDVLLEVLHVDRVFRDDDPESEDFQALSDINFELRRGEFVSIIGQSGCGKTTLLRLVAGLDRPENGKILLNGRRVKGPDSRLGYVFQQGGLFDWLTVKQNIAVGLKARHVYKQQKDRIGEFIHMVGLDGFEGSYPHQISGGMAQRVAIARSLINDPEILLLDEPMGALDSFTRADIQDNLLEIRKNNNTTMLLVTHDIDEALYLSDRIIIMTPRPGRISQIIPVNLPHPRERGGPEFIELRREIMDTFHLATAEPKPEYYI